MSRRRSKKLCSLIGQNIAPDPLVGSGNPPHRRQACTTAHSTRAHHRMVTLAKSSPSRSTTRPSQKKSATVMLILAHDLVRKPVSTFRDHALVREQKPAQQQNRLAG